MQNPNDSQLHHSNASAPDTRTISKTEINQLPLIRWTGEIQILESIDQMSAAVEKLAGEAVLGFDTETRPSFNKGEYYPPALIQLSSADCVYLFRINRTQTLAPLRPILESATPLKVGVAIKDDVKALRKMEDFQADGFVEINDITQPLGYTNRSLRALAALLMHGRISKAAQVSNWARAQLDSKQIHYAATDAWISRELYCRAIAERDSR